MKQQKEPDDEWNGVGDEDCDGAALHESSGDESLGAWVKQWKEPDDEWHGVGDEDCDGAALHESSGDKDRGLE